MDTGHEGTFHYFVILKAEHEERLGDISEAVINEHLADAPDDAYYMRDSATRRGRRRSRPSTVSCTGVPRPDGDGARPGRVAGVHQPGQDGAQRGRRPRVARAPGRSVLHVGTTQERLLPGEQPRERPSIARSASPSTGTRTRPARTTRDPRGANDMDRRVAYVHPKYPYIEAVRMLSGGSTARIRGACSPRLIPPPSICRSTASSRSTRGPSSLTPRASTSPAAPPPPPARTSSTTCGEATATASTSTCSTP